MKKKKAGGFIKIVINNIKAAASPKQMRDHIFRHQTFITLFLSTIFILLIAMQTVYPERNFDIPFSLVAGWLGIIIGFFFNQQIADFFLGLGRTSQV